jgi:hypothetical protein
VENNKLYYSNQRFRLHPKKASYPPIETIVARVTSEGYEELARELGVSGNAIRKYLKNRLGYTPKRGDAGGPKQTNVE